MHRWGSTLSDGLLPAEIFDGKMVNYLDFRSNHLIRLLHIIISQYLTHIGFNKMQISCTWKYIIALCLNQVGGPRSGCFCGGGLVFSCDAAEEFIICRCVAIFSGRTKCLYVWECKPLHWITPEWRLDSAFPIRWKSPLHVWMISVKLIWGGNLRANINLPTSPHPPLPYRLGTPTAAVVKRNNIEISLLWILNKIKNYI